MPIDRLLKLRSIGPENSERLRLAFKFALRGLQLVDRNDPICDIVARKVIEIDKYGTHDARQIAAEAIKQLGQ